MTRAGFRGRHRAECICRLRSEVAGKLPLDGLFAEWLVKLLNAILRYKILSIRTGPFDPNDNMVIPS
jgi:hypothetical protein